MSFFPETEMPSLGTHIYVNSRFNTWDNWIFSRNGESLALLTKHPVKSAIVWIVNRKGITWLRPSGKPRFQGWYSLVEWLWVISHRWKWERQLDQVVRWWQEKNSWSLIFPAVKKAEQTWMDLEISILNEVSQEDRYHLIPLTCGI